MNNLKNMTNKEKAEYIWDYYKLHIMGVLILIFVVGSFIHGQVIKIDYEFKITLLGSISDEKKIDDFEKQLTSLVVKEGERKKEALVDVIPLEGADSGLSSMYMQKFIAELSGGGLDIVVLDKNLFKTFVEQGVFSRLDNIVELDLTAVKEGKIEAVGDDSERAIFALEASDIKRLQEAGFNTQNKVIGIVESTKQKDKAVMVLKWILSK
jgi:hypothetical protein